MKSVTLCALIVALCVCGAAAVPVMVYEVPVEDLTADVPLTLLDVEESAGDYAEPAGERVARGLGFGGFGGGLGGKFGGFGGLGGLKGGFGGLGHGFGGGFGGHGFGGGLGSFKGLFNKF